MLHIFFMILKITGLILLGILGLLLGILLFVLFSAIRYQIDGEKQERITGQVQVKWLLGMVTVLAVYEQGLRVRVKVLWHTFFDSGEEEEEEEEKRSASGEDRSDLSGEEPLESWFQDGEENADSPEEPEDCSPLESSEHSLPEKTEKSTIKEYSEESETREKSEEKNTKRFSFQGICDKLKSIWSFLTGIPKRMERIGEKLASLQAHYETLSAYLSDPLNQKSFHLILKQLKRILAYVLSGKGRGEITFGLEDPYTMGQLLQAAAFLYPFTRDRLILHPVFGASVLTGELHYKGHLRIGVILFMALRLLLDRNIRRQLIAFLKKDAGTGAEETSGKRSGKQRSEKQGSGKRRSGKRRSGKQGSGKRSKTRE